MSPPAAPAGIDPRTPRPVDLASIERELTRLWKPTGAPAPGPSAVIRACMSNLLVYCADESEAGPLPEELDLIVRLHPSRVLLLVGDPSAPPSELEAYVSAHCHRDGGGHQVCSEQVTVSASGDAVQRLPSTARALLLGDLPTSLWWATHTPPTFHGEFFEELKAMADQVIYSSLAWPDPVRGTLATAAWATEAGLDDPVVSDLAWRRLEPWRSLIGQTLDPSSLPGALEAIDRVVIEHGPHGLPQAWLLVGWLARALGWHPGEGHARRGAELTWRFLSPHGPVDVRIVRQAEGDPAIRDVEIGWSIAGQRSCMRFASTNVSRLAVTCDGIDAEPRVLATPIRTRAQLVATQLQELEPDPLFHDALVVARAMAETLAP